MDVRAKQRLSYLACLFSLTLRVAVSPHVISAVVLLSVMSVGKTKAREIAFAKLPNIWDIDGDEPIILDEHTIERDWGWVFFWGSRKFEETQDFKFALAGNAPILVKRSDGSAHFTTTAIPVEQYLEENADELGLIAPVWCLVVDEAESLALLSKLRRALNLTVLEVGELKGLLPGCIRRGTRKEMRKLSGLLEAEGVKAKVEEAS